MKALRPRLTKTAATLAVLLACTSPAPAQDKGTWRAASTTAKGITGDITFSGTRIILNFSGFTVAQIRDLQPAEARAVFNFDTDAADTPGTGNLYRTSIPAAKQFLHHNTLCGSEETQWILTWLSGKTLQLAFFSGAAIPALTPEAMANATDLCGTYTYVR